MSFLAKFKTKRGAALSKSPTTVTPSQQPEPPITLQKEPTPPPQPSSPAHAVEIDSIFTGLKLSAQVASKEGDGSPYLQRNSPLEPADDSENAPSSFSFLKPVSTPPDNSPEIEQSQFDFLSGQQETEQEVEQEEKPSGFSFMQESQNIEPTSKLPEIINEPQAPLMKSHDKDTKSHDKNTKLHDTKHSPVTKAPRQLAPNVAVKKKKKKIAKRPGQMVKEEPQENDSISLSSHASSIDSSRLDDIPLSPDRGAVGETQSYDQGVAQLVDIDFKDDQVSTTDKLEAPKEEVEVPIVSIEKVVQNSEKVDGENNDTKMKKNDSKLTEHNKVIAPTQTTPTDDQTPPINEELDREELTEVFTQPANYSLELSAGDKLTILLEGFESGLARIRGGQSIEALRSAVLASVSDARQQVEKRKLVRVLKSQQSQALTEEDYELAEQLNQQLEETKLTQEHHIASTALKSVSQWLVECRETDQNEIAFRGDMQSKMAVLQEEHTKALAQLDKEHSSLIAKDKMKLQSMENTLEREKGHIALDKEHLEKRETVLTEEVQRRAVNFIASKQSLEEELQTIKEEIANLEEKLVSLKAQQSSLVTLIGEEEGRIASVEEELATEKSQLAEEREAISVKEEQLAKKQEKLAEERASLASSHDELNTSREGLATLVTRAQTVTDEFERTVEGLKKAEAETEGLLSLGDEGRNLLTPSEKLTGLLKRTEKSSTKVDSLTSAVLATQSQLSRERKELSDIQAQIPQLNDAKKTAVTGRQFKEASRIASELKTITGREEEVKGQISDTEAKLSGLNKELSQHSKELEVIKNETDAQEKQEDEAHLRALLGNLSKLKGVKGHLESSSLSEVVSKWVELYLLLADNLAVKHSWKLEEFMSDIADSPTTELSVEKTSLDEEHTPAVAEEEKTTPTDTPTNDEIADVERQIEEAVAVEDYDKAAELEEKLTQLKAGAEIQE